jgi:hypothetical protein
LRFMYQYPDLTGLEGAAASYLCADTPVLCGSTSSGPLHRRMQRQTVTPQRRGAQTLRTVKDDAVCTVSIASTTSLVEVSIRQLRALTPRSSWPGSVTAGGSRRGHGQDRPSRQTLYRAAGDHRDACGPATRKGGRALRGAPGGSARPGPRWPCRAGARRCEGRSDSACPEAVRRSPGSGGNLTCSSPPMMSASVLVRAWLALIISWSQCTWPG